MIAMIRNLNCNSAEIGHSTDWMIVLILTNYVESRNAKPCDFMVMKIEFIFATEAVVVVEIIVELVVRDELKSWIIVYKIVPKCIQICIIYWEYLSSGYIVHWGKWRRRLFALLKLALFIALILFSIDHQNNVEWKIVYRNIGRQKYTYLRHKVK